MNKRLLKIIIQGTSLAGIIIAAFYLARFAKGSEAIQAAVALYGYVGVLIVSFVSGLNLAIPVPAIAFMPLFLESGLSFWFSIFYIAVGVTIADCVAYSLGRFGRHITLHVADGRVFKYLERMYKKHKWGPLVALFLFVSLVPFQNELLLIPLGFLGYRAVHIFPILIAGNFIFNIFYVASVMKLFEFF
ncbi:MAG: hypothetical protein Q8R36_02040 [bacterium]|nr:hypothetical protein [bacterium]